MPATGARRRRPPPPRWRCRCGSICWPISPASRRGLSAGLARLFGERRLHLAGLARGLPLPQDLIGNAAQRLDDRAERLRLAAERHLRAARHSLDLAAVRLRPEVLAADLDRAGARLIETEARLRAAMARFDRRRSTTRSTISPAGLRPTRSGTRACSRAAMSWCATAMRGSSPRLPRSSLAQALDLEFYDGKVGAIAGRTPRRPVRRAPPRPEQGNLF